MFANSNLFFFNFLLVLKVLSKAIVGWYTGMINRSNTSDQLKFSFYYWCSIEKYDKARYQYLYDTQDRIAFQKSSKIFLDPSDIITMTFFSFPVKDPE